MGGSIVPCLSGPKRPHDRVTFSTMKQDFHECMRNEIGFKGFGLKEEEIKKSITVNYEGTDYEITQGSLVIAAITSCTNTSSPDVMLQADMLASAVLSGNRNFEGRVHPHTRANYLASPPLV